MKLKKKDKFKEYSLSKNLSVLSSKSGKTSVSSNVRGPPVRGKPKSGRVWKAVRTERHSAIQKDKAMHTSWSKKMEARALRKNVKLHEKELKDQIKQEKEGKRLRAEENRKRRLENERKSEVVQVIKDTRKIKRMRKKQLRTIEKR